MTQHAMTIANQAGAAFRGDLNNALVAIVSMNSGPTAPATTYAYMTWADTTTGLLKQRDAANAAWVVIGTLGAVNLGLLSLAGGNMTGAINEARTTVASSATPDIWTGTGNNINYTGTTTATGFSAAPQAGARRVLDCAAAASFTAGANLLIDNVTSGNTLTVAAGDRVEVFARTTTVFVLKLVSGLMAQTQADARYAPITIFPRSYIAGCTLSTAGSSTTMSIAAGQASDSTNATLMSLAASISKTTSAWAVGSGNGGLDTGAIANATWYYFYLIRRPDTGVVDVVFSLSSSAPTLPTNYTQYRYIGAGLTNGSDQWTKFVQVGDEFVWDTPVMDFSGTASTTARLLTISVPRGRKVKALLACAVNNASGAEIYISDPDTADITTSQTAVPLDDAYAPGGSQNTGKALVWTNASAQVRHREGLNSGTNYIVTRGWADLRGGND